LIETVPRAAILDLVDHFVDRPVAELETVHQWLGAERATLWHPRDV